MLSLPPGSRTVRVYTLSPNRVLNVPPSAFLTPDIPGTTYEDTPCLSFLVEHGNDDGTVTRLLFDLGIRKDWENLPPKAETAIKSMNIQISTPLDVPDLLANHGVEPTSINSIILSHAHFDHVGDATKFPPSTRLVVGPGFKAAHLPGYPADPDAMLHGDAFAEREVCELDFARADTSIASLAAVDWFGDGSFFLLDTPGHAAGHMSALARTTLAHDGASSTDTFVFLVGDVCHHAGELRPHAGYSLPDTIPNSVPSVDNYQPSAHYLVLHPSKSLECPFYQPSKGGFNLDAKRMRETARKVALLDADPRVFVMLAHDHWLLDVVDLFPASVNGWQNAGWDERVRWRFLQDFQ